MLAHRPGSWNANANWPRRLILWASIAAILFLCVWYVFEIILLAFAGALLAIVLHACADWVQRYTPKGIGPRLSYTATVLGILILACLIAYWIVPQAISEGSRIATIIPQSLAQVSTYLDKTDWGRHVVHAAHRLLSGSGAKISAITQGVGTAVEYTIVIVVVGLYGALYAREYSKGMLAWIPERHRRSVARVSSGVAYTLRWWVLGQLVPMFALGIVTMIGLWALGVPLAFALGLLTGVMIFIPYVGSWIAFVPTVLVAWTEGPRTAIYVTILYLVVHLLEGYVLTPMVQKRAVLLPPVLTILALLFMWTVSGLLGAALATPIAAAFLALGKMLYLQQDVEH